MKRSPSKLDRLKAALDGHPIPPPSKAQLDALHSVITSRVVTANIGAAYAGFHRWKNPLYLLEGFVTAQRAGIPMPDWILDAIRPAFEKVLKARGAITLDAALGLSRKRGSRTWWTERTQRDKDDRLKWLIEERPRLLDKLEADPRLKGLLPARPRPTTTLYGAIDQAMAVLYPEGDITGAAVESQNQRYTKKLRTRPSR